MGEHERATRYFVRFFFLTRVLLPISTFFGEDPAQMNLGQLLQIFFQFVVDYRQAEAFLKQEVRIHISSFLGFAFR